MADTGGNSESIAAEKSLMETHPASPESLSSGISDGGHSDTEIIEGSAQLTSQLPPPPAPSQPSIEGGTQTRTEEAGTGTSPAAVRPQRGPITYDDIAKYFTETIVDAAHKLGMGVTQFKLLCRSFGVARWPYRKLRSLARQTGATSPVDAQALIRSAPELFSIHPRQPTMASVLARQAAKLAANTQRAALAAGQQQGMFQPPHVSYTPGQTFTTAAPFPVRQPAYYMVATPDPSGGPGYLTSPPMPVNFPPGQGFVAGRGAFDQLTQPVTTTTSSASQHSRTSTSQQASTSQSTAPTTPSRLSNDEVDYLLQRFHSFAQTSGERKPSPDRAL